MLKIIVVVLSVSKPIEYGIYVNAMCRFAAHYE